MGSGDRNKAHPINDEDVVHSSDSRDDDEDEAKDDLTEQENSQGIFADSSDVQWMLWLIDIFFPLENLYSCGEVSNTGEGLQIWTELPVIAVKPPLPPLSKAVATGQRPKFATFSDFISEIFLNRAINN